MPLAQTVPIAFDQKRAALMAIGRLPRGVVHIADIGMADAGFRRAQTLQGDARSKAAKVSINNTIEAAVKSGAVTRKDLASRFSEAASTALYDDPRAELVANWNECRAEFAPKS